ncbi:hypothetical protein PoB_000611600, partial [Plakobranchus ocellatus]
MSDRSTQAKEYILDCMYEKFCADSKAYISEVKAALRSQSKVNAVDIFERAIDVLSQDFPDPTSIDEQTQEEEGGDGNELNSLKDRIDQMEKQLKEAQNEKSTLESELKSVRQEAQKERSTLESELKSVRHEAQNKCAALVSELESVKEEAQTNCSFLETQLNSIMKKNVRLDAKIGDLKNDMETLASETKETDSSSSSSNSSSSNSHSSTYWCDCFSNIKATERRQRTNFTAKVEKDQSTPDIQDVQLLPGGRILLTDWGNKCVKLFDTQGRHLYRLPCRSSPSHLAVLDISGDSKCITVVVTLPNCSALDILEVARDDITVKKTLQTSIKYYTVAAVNNQSLAVASWRLYHPGIDLIDLDGRVLRQICSSVPTWYMDITEDGELVCSALGSTIARVKVDNGNVVFNNS